MSDLWTPEPERERVNFSELELVVEEGLPTKTGGTYTMITFNLFPIGGGGDMVDDKYPKFGGHSKPWDSDVLPALRELVTAGKIKDASQINGKFVSWAFRQWRSYRKNDVQYWRDRAETERKNGQEDEAKKSISRIQFDEKGNEFVEKRYVHILDVFDSEAACQKASDDFYGVQESSTSNVFGEPEPEAPTGFGDKQNAMAFLPSFVKMALDENHKVDVDKLTEFIESNDVLKAHFTVDSSEVQEEIAKLEATPPF